MVKIIEQKAVILTPLGPEILKILEVAARNCYKSEGSISEGSDVRILSQIIKSGHESVLEHFQINAILTTDVGAYKDLTRHRHAHFSIESTRWCNYSKGKFGSEITVIKPVNMDPESGIYHTWLKQMNDMEKAYMQMAEIGATADQLRMILPHSTKADVYISANIREWRHILKIRTAKNVHPSLRALMIDVLNQFKEKVPLLFDDIVVDN